MDPDGDYESRHSTQSTASNDVDMADISSPSKIFAPDDDTKLPAKPTKGEDSYEGPTAPPMEDAIPPASAAAANSSHRQAMEHLGTTYDDMMTGKMDLAASDEAPISNSVAVPIGFDSEDMALPEAKALPIISSTANEGTKMPPATLDEVDAEGAEEYVNEEDPTPIPVPLSSEENQASTNPNSTTDEGTTEEENKSTSTKRENTRRRKVCCCGIVAFLAVLGTVLGVLFGTEKGQLIIKGYPNCDGYWWTSDIGNGHCSKRVNTAECGWDGGDCEEFNHKYPNCDVEYPSWINDGSCASGEYNTEECGWDGGDCLFDKRYDIACTGTIGSTWNDQTRAWCQYKCMDEGSYCEAYDYNYDTDTCRLFSRFQSTLGSRKCWVKRDSALAAEDIIEKLSECISGNPATGGINERCVGGVLSTLSQDTIDKLTPCAGLVVNEWKACIFGQFLN